MRINIILDLLDDEGNELSTTHTSVDISDHAYEYRAIHDDICAVTWDMLRHIIDNQEPTTNIPPVDVPADTGNSDSWKVSEAIYEPPKGDLT